ncbi:fucose isomerase [Roseburia sp. AM16-25]|uniref:fucose isomerase n=1 Tax=Roseburia sp. AM16-25 TaxID=2292065 RepID=UPI000E4D03D6|nr:fucose isomerase [Roseburia sp. AM16-25]RHO33003.1 fucose isomerase [Roseburia sp. AM16-25]
MKKEFQIAYVPIGVPTFHLESAQKEFDKSVALIKSLTDACVFPKEMLLSIDLLDAFLEECQPDLVILQNITFANAAYASEVLKKLDCPILLWTLREPAIDGGRLRLNSLTGAYSAANAIKAFRKEPLNYIFGSPEEEEVRAKVGATIRAAKLKYDMRHLTVAAVGHTPQGFGFGRALDLEMLENFGASLESIEARELIDIAKGYSDEDVKDYLADAGERMCGLENTPEQNRKDFARLYRAYKEYVKDHHVGALASRCWPDFFTAFGTPVCAVLAMLNDLGVAASCEADTYGALSMYLGMQLTQQATFFGDPVSMDEKENTITFWHCGTAACSLAREDTGAKVDVHCNRKIGPTLDFGCKPCKEVTIFRIGKDSDGDFRFFIAGGEALDKPKQFNGTSLVVKTNADAKTIVYESVEAGWEPHFVVAYGNVAAELEILAGMLNMEVQRY